MKAAVITITLNIILLAIITSVDSLGDILEPCRYDKPRTGSCSDADDCRKKGNWENGMTCMSNGECCFDYCEPGFGTHRYPGKCACP